jgi:hypothetical protein
MGELQARRSGHGEVEALPLVVANTVSFILDGNSEVAILTPATAPGVAHDPVTFAA